MATTFVKIASVTVGASGQTSIDFTSIPSTYTDLVVKASLRSSNTDDNIEIRFNNSATSYSSRSLLGNGSTATSATRSDYYFIGTIALSSRTASVFSNLEMYVPNYTSSNNKSFSIDAVEENNATTALSTLIAGLWSNTSAITSISLIKTSGTFVQYSSATLYGIKSS